MTERVLIHPPIDQPQQWPAVATGTVLEVLKVDFDGEIKTRYAGRVIEVGQPSPWVALECAWVLPTAVAHGLHLVTGDTLLEYFSPEHPYNVFRIHAPDGTLRGWYANVTYPTVVDGITLAWHDLWLDVIMLPDGSFVVCDQDELDEAGIEHSDPPLHAAIVAACDELVRLAEARAFPFNLP